MPSLLFNFLNKYLLGSKNPASRVSDEDVGKISMDVVKVWKPLGRALGISDADLNIIDLDNSNAVYEKSYQMLTKWKQTKVSKANYGDLAKAFVHPAVGREDLISKYC